MYRLRLALVSTDLQVMSKVSKKKQDVKSADAKVLCIRGGTEVRKRDFEIRVITSHTLFPSQKSGYFKNKISMLIEFSSVNDDRVRRRKMHSDNPEPTSGLEQSSDSLFSKYFLASLTKKVNNVQRRNLNITSDLSLQPHSLRLSQHVIVIIQGLNLRGRYGNWGYGRGTAMVNLHVARLR